jgi:hypothetical protein
MYVTKRNAPGIARIIFTRLDGLGIMETYTMLQTAAVLFGVAALGGVLMAGMRFSGIPRPPAWMAMGHGLLAAAGLTLFIYVAKTADIPPMAQFALGLLVIAAIGGVTMNLLFHWKLLPLPIPLMVLHAVLAVIGFVLLLVCIHGQPLT